ncbi:MFS transporter [Shewanella surugensis]|uniref:MFS transporter n=1 Tax=Shewanella surugensis TaxID=212020 RepID=A0ABT0LHL5_9GAMM|nr:MFS transporter [Shewanella surugensis]MCL1127184.1 MFS transporter [Shewanella surugensis]
MSPLSRFALIAVVFVDLMGQGLVFPIINELMMSKTIAFLPLDISDPERHFFYGLVIGIFFLSWFLGAVYIAKLSDSIGRKNAILICLFGALIGYFITILAIFLNSLWLLVVGRSITGFTAGNQPIAQAATMDASKNDKDKARNMGFIVAGISAGLMGGPLIGGVLSDKAIIGSLASVQLPFYAASILVLITLFLVLFSYQDVRKPNKDILFKPLEIFTMILKLRDKPLVLRLSGVYLSFMTANVTFYIFLTNYLSSRFQIGLFGTSMAMLIMGSMIAFSSLFLIERVLNHLGKRRTIAVVAMVMTLSVLVFSMSSSVFVCYIAIAVFYLGFGVAYPTLLCLFSDSVSQDEQGWSMGITTAGFTLAAGVMSLVGGILMGLDIHLPFYICAVAAITSLILMKLTWNTPDIERVLSKSP